MFATDGQGNYAPAATVTVTTAKAVVAGSPLSAVTNVTAVPEGSSGVALSWSNPATSLYKGVMVRRNNGTVAPKSVTEGRIVTNAWAPRTTVTNTGLPAGTTYSYALFATDGQGNYAPAATVTVTTTADPNAVPTLSDQRTVLSDRISVANQQYVDSRPYVSLLARADGLQVKDAIAAGIVSLEGTAALVTAASTQTLMTAAAQAVKTESLRAATVKTSAEQLKMTKDLRGIQQGIATTALTDLNAGRIPRSTFEAIETRTAAFTTLLAADTASQLKTIGEALPASGLQAPQWRDEMETGSAAVPAAQGWVGFSGGCALPVAEEKFLPKLPISGPGIATNSSLVASANSRGVSNPTLSGIHGQMLRGATAQAAEVLTLEQLQGNFSPRVARLGYGWLEAADTKAGDALRADTHRVLEAGPESMNTLTASHLLLAAATAADWTSSEGMKETVLIRWVGPQTCLQADRENFVDAPTNIAALHNSATFVASAVFLEDSPEQAAALAKESLVSIQPALNLITADGGTGEGPGYWTYQSRAIATLYSTLPNVYETNPLPMPSLAETSDYALNSTGPDGLPTPFADAEPNALSPLMPAWDAYARKDPAVAAWVSDELQKKPDAYLMWWWTEPGALPAKRDSLYPQTGLAALHLPNGTATLKGGDNSVNHAHLDLGTVSFFRRGVQWAVDPGAELKAPSAYYGAATRWNYWKPGTSAHSTLTVNGANQPLTAKAATTLPSSSTAAVNMVQALPGATSATRTVTHNSADLIVKDSVRSSSGMQLTWQWVTDARVTVDASTNRAVMTKNGQTANMRFDGVPPGSVLSAVTAPGTGPDGSELTVIKLTMPAVTSLDLTATIQ
ncbi:hypothetical protein IWX75_001982 [Arthrobacter sp. CAN_A6]|uniref:heparinase II/III domain-containing protein n=1 Tax=Arthrobacter sp. CAN_A6 TaxID=2787721 RepID=UPI0018CBE649